MARKNVRLTYIPTGELLAEGPFGWGITPFEGNYYIQKKYLRSSGFKFNYIPDLCWYKLLYVWIDYISPTGDRVRNLGWYYWLPNPLFPFTAFRIGIPARHPLISIEVGEADSLTSVP